MKLLSFICVKITIDVFAYTSASGDCFHAFLIIGPFGLYE